MRLELTRQRLNRWINLFEQFRCLKVDFSDPVVEGFLALGWIEQYRPNCYRPTAEGRKFMGLSA